MNPLPARHHDDAELIGRSFGDPDAFAELCDRPGQR
jgi:hypothetical protein